MKVVVTGASGFLGRNVLRVLAAQRNLELIPVTRQKISGWISVADYSQSPAGDVLIHLAEDADRSQVAKAGSVYEEKVHATLSALLAKDYSRVVYASSAVLYGDRDGRAHFPGDLLMVSDAYSRIKRQSELAILASPGGVVARLANIYGPGMSQNNVMSTILRQLSGAGLLEIMNASPVRDFLWVEDAAEGIVALALNCPGEGKNGRVFNLGTGVGTSIGVVARMALEIAGQADRSVVSNSLAGCRSRLLVDSSDTTTACGWQPKTSLQQGLASMLSVGKEEI